MARGSSAWQSIEEVSLIEAVAQLAHARRAFPIVVRARHAGTEPPQVPLVLAEEAHEANSYDDRHHYAQRTRHQSGHRLAPIVGLSPRRARHPDCSENDRDEAQWKRQGGEYYEDGEDEAHYPGHESCSADSIASP